MSKWVLSRLHQRVCERAEAVDVVVHSPLASPTRAGYRRWLCELYRFVAALENSLLFTSGLEPVFIKRRIKSGRLAADLMALGLTKPEHERLLKRCVVPAFGDPLEALGWLIVVDRLTLQLDSIRDRLLPAIGLELEIAGAFLDVYNGAAALKWIELASVIERWVVDDQDMDRIAASALAALDCLEASVTETREAGLTLRDRPDYGDDRRASMPHAPTPDAR